MDKDERMKLAFISALAILANAVDSDGSLKGSYYTNSVGELLIHGTEYQIQLCLQANKEYWIGEHDLHWDNPANKELI